MKRLRKIELAQIIEANAIVRLEMWGECVGVLAKPEFSEITFAGLEAKLSNSAPLGEIPAPIWVY
jgi:hypothetical protein